MGERAEDLPEFDRPPVVEVALGVQFSPIPGFRQAHIGLLWSQVRNEYPLTQDQPRLQTAVESLDEDFPVSTIQFELVDSPPLHRAWMLSDDQVYLLQIQDDRLIHNWRYQGTPYPRYERLADMFWTHIDRYDKTLRGAGLEPTPVQQAEVTYVNWIPASSMAEFLRPSATADIEVPGIGPHPDLQGWSARYAVWDAGRAIGRLAIAVQPGRRDEGGTATTGYQLALTFRAPVQPDAGRTEVSALLDLGRNAIVRGFTDLTTETMHQNWGRTT